MLILAQKIEMHAYEESIKTGMKNVHYEKTINLKTSVKTYSYLKDLGRVR